MSGPGIWEDINMGHTRIHRDDRRRPLDRAPKLIDKRTFWKRARAAARSEIIAIISALSEPRASPPRRGPLTGEIHR
ncbi:MAG: hypothetical protein PHI71_00460 [Acidiphilium sp.]|nr:hypothetical protein [Acidiphilium sp.]